jgi:arabinofuranosyltransferase
MPGRFPLRIGNRGFTALYCAVFVLLIILAWSNRFVQDDAFISFRYADNLARGNGLVWSGEERVEGYSNFLWTVLMSVPLRMGIDPVPFSFVAGLACFAGSLILIYRLCALLLSRTAGLIATIVLGTNYTFSAYATGGLETPLQAFLFVACIYIIARSMRTRSWNPVALALLSLLMGIAILTHIDSALLPIVCIPATLLFVLAEKAPGRRKILNTACLLTPCFVIVGVWLIWKYRYYGDIVPNSFYVKAATSTSMRRGLRYLYLFVTQYWLFPLVILGTIELRALRRTENLIMLIVLILIGLWSAYIVRVGGDFMEFRFIVPILPLIFIFIAWLIFERVQLRGVQIMLVAILLLGSLQHHHSFKHRHNRYGIDTIEELHGHIHDHNQNWAAIGEVLGRSFEYDPAVTVATTACGAIGFYSRLTTIDMHGLNDRWIAKHGIVFGTRPGHQRMASIGHLVARKVNLVISHPVVKPMSEEIDYSAKDRRGIIGVYGDGRIPDDAVVLEIPIDREWKLISLYITRSPAIDAAIERNNWNAYPLRGAGRAFPYRVG